MLLVLVDLVTGKTQPLGETTGNERWAPVGKRTRLLTAPVSSFGFSPDGSSIVLARGKGGGVAGTSTTDRNDLFLLHLSGRRLERLTDDGHSRSPLVSRTGIAYVRFENAYGTPEMWLMRGDGSGRRRIARCCESKWTYTHAQTIQGFETVALSADGRRLLACQPWEGGCYPVAIDLPGGRQYTFPETRKLGTPQESASALDNPWDDEPGPDLLYAVAFTGGKPKLLARGAFFARWRS